MLHHGLKSCAQSHAHCWSERNQEIMRRFHNATSAEITVNEVSREFRQHLRNCKSPHTSCTNAMGPSGFWLQFAKGFTLFYDHKTTFWVTGTKALLSSVSLLIALPTFCTGNTLYLISKGQTHAQHTTSSAGQTTEI